MSFSDIGNSLIKNASLEILSPNNGKYMCNYCYKVLGYEAPSVPWLCGNEIDNDPLLTKDEYIETYGDMPTGRNSVGESFEEYLANETKERELMTKVLPDGKVICQSTTFSRIEPMEINNFSSAAHNFWKEFIAKPDSTVGYNSMIGSIQADYNTSQPGENIPARFRSSEITRLPPSGHAENCNGSCNNKIYGINSDVLQGCFNTVIGYNVTVKGSYNVILANDVLVEGDHIVSLN